MRAWSLAQQRMLARLGPDGENWDDAWRSESKNRTWHRDRGRYASAWYRTALSLERAGAVTLERSGDSWRARRNA